MGYLRKQWPHTRDCIGKDFDRKLYRGFAAAKLAGAIRLGEQRWTPGPPGLYNPKVYLGSVRAQGHISTRFASFSSESVA